MNKSDSERVAAVFEHLSYSKAEKDEEFDYLVVNACSVRQSAINRIWGIVRSFEKRKVKKKPIMILTGCLLSRDKKKFKKLFDFVFNIKKLNELEQFVNQKEVYTSENYFDLFPKPATEYLAYVPIMTGCNNFCSYCAVPYVRGRETSRDVKDILKEIRVLLKKGIKEIHLLGQNVNSYNPKDAFSKNNPYKQKFAMLLWEVSQLSGLERLNFSSSHPKDLDDDVIQAMTMPKMINYLHLALQSGDNEILKAMNRNYTVEHFETLINKLRKVKPGIAIGTDVIVGFPGETKEQFENTLNFYKKIDLDITFHSKYSTRPGTAAAKLKDDVSIDEKKRRWQEFQDLMVAMSLKKNKKYVGKEVSVLIDKVTEDFSEGNSLEMKRVRTKTRYKIGDIVNLTVTKAQEWMLLT